MDGFVWFGMGVLLCYIGGFMGIWTACIALIATVVGLVYVVMNEEVVACPTRIGKKKGTRDSLKGVINSLLSLTSLSTLSSDDISKAALKRMNKKKFEEEDFKAPFSLLIDSINKEAKLTPFGKFMTKEKMTDALSQRLSYEYFFKNFPEINEEIIESPVVVLGLARTGTTKLQRLFGSNQHLRDIQSWETVSPFPKNIELYLKNPKQEMEERKNITKTSATFLKIFFPEFYAIHPIDPSQSEEEITILDLSFFSQVGEALYDMKTYPQFLSERDAMPAYTFLKKTLQFLQWSDKRIGLPQRRFLLKTPEHMDHLDDLLAVFPDARFVFTHRKVSEAIPSFLSMVAHGWDVFSDSVQLDRVVEHWLPKMKRMAERAIQFRKQHDEKFIDVHYKDSFDDPIQFMKTLCKQLDIEFGKEEEQSLSFWIKNNSQHKNGRHIYSAEAFGMTKKDIETCFHFYTEWEREILGEKMDQ